MQHTFRYHTRASSWGITISLTAEAVPLSAHNGSAIEIADSIWVNALDAVVSGERASGEKYFMRFTTEEQEYLKLGIKLVSETIHSCPYIQLPIVVCLQRLEFGLCDYQPEGLACAVSGWAAQAWNIPIPIVPVRYDKPKDVYFFKFPGLPEMGTHALNGRFVLE